MKKENSMISKKEHPKLSRHVGRFLYGTTEYSDAIIYKDGKLNKVLFLGGYCTFDHDTQEPQFHYFTQDHLGNNRAR